MKVFEAYIEDLKYLVLAEQPEEALRKIQNYRERRNKDGSFPKVTGVMYLGDVIEG